MNIQDKLQEKTVSLLSEELNEINSDYLSEPRTFNARVNVYAYEE